MRYLVALFAALSILVVLVTPASAAEGNFLIGCTYTQTGSFDPIGGATHEHAFGGSLALSPTSSPYQMLTGGTSCAVGGETPGVWHPTIVAPDGSSQHFTRFTIYYRNGDASQYKVLPFPFGFKHVHGNSKNTSGSSYAATYLCYGSSGSTRSVTIPTSCPAGNGFLEDMFFAFCWDGKSLDETNDGLAHHTMTKCDADHPIRLPAINLTITWPQSAVGGKLTSDIENMAAAGLTAHADYWFTLNPFFFDKVVERCLNQGIQCRVGNGAGPPAGSVYNFSDPTHPVVLTVAEAQSF